MHSKICLTNVKLHQAIKHLAPAFFFFLNIQFDDSTINQVKSSWIPSTVDE